MNKELLFTVTKNDCRFDYYRGSGAGGQKRNKTSNCCRCTHIASGAVGKSEEGRSKDQNTKRAFRRMYETNEFQRWAEVEAARVTGKLKEIEDAVDKSMEFVRVEIKSEEGKWIKDDKKS